MTAAVKEHLDPVAFIAAIFFIRIYSLFSFVALAASFPLLDGYEKIPLLLAAYPFFQACGQMPFGWIADHFSPIYALRWGLILFGVATFGCIAAPNVYWLFAFRSLQGFCALGAPAQYWLAQLSASSHQLQSRYYLIGAAIVLGLLISFLSAAVAQSYQSPYLVFVITLGMIILLVLKSYKLPKITAPPMSTQPSELSLSVVYIFFANLTLHFLQSFILGGYHALSISFRMASDTILMTGSLILSLLICASPMRRRDYMYSIKFSRLLSAILIGVSLSPIIGLKETYIVSIAILVGIFSLLLLLEAALPTALKQCSHSSGRMLGLYNTMQYGSMTAGSLFTVYADNTAIFFSMTAIMMLALYTVLHRLSANPSIYEDPS